MKHIYRSKREDRLTILVRDRTGLVLVHKRIERCMFVSQRLPTPRCVCRRRCSPSDSRGWLGGWHARSKHGVDKSPDTCGRMTRSRATHCTSRADVLNIAPKHCDTWTGTYALECASEVNVGVVRPFAFV
ncbi:hypothetical protein [Bradyrhizobium sp. DOA9]|uniref:hypothetical protein n=1 Tax=Bradyrhizobium sp. DOA9 TaxID=1126627 RepID=UPI0040402179